MAEYVLTMNSNQTKETLKAIELLMRLKIKQFDILPYNLLDIGAKDYCDKRDAAEPLLRDLGEIFFPGWHYSKDEEWNRLYDLYQVLRHAIHDAEYPTCKSQYADEPAQYSREPLPKIEWRKEHGQD